eukprot:782799-Amphidinium_carterae.1
MSARTNTSMVAWPLNEVVSLRIQEGLQPCPTTRSTPNLSQTTDQPGTASRAEGGVPQTAALVS